LVRYGILGFGHHAIKRLIPAFTATKNSKLTGIWRRDPVKAAANAELYGIEHVFGSAEELCASPEIDAVFIASPDALHLPEVLLAAKHRKPVLCEKPLGMNVSEVEQMLAAVEAAHVPFGVAQNMRYYRSLHLMQKWIAEGRIGKVALAHSQFCYEAERSPREWIYDPKLACGGPIGDVGVHCIDSLRFVLGTDVAAVNTVARKDEGSGAVESYAALSLELTSGALAAVTVTTRAAYRSLVEVSGETGVILCENALTVEHPIDVVLRRGAKVEISEQVSNSSAYSLMLDGFADQIEGRGQYLAPGTDGLHNQRVLDAAYRSWNDGRIETIR
jgi:predicted dehydrogenase